MALAKDLMQVGIVDQAAQRLGFTLGTATGAGTTNADAFQLLKDATLIICDGAVNSGFKMPSDAELGIPYILVSVDTDAMLLYPGTGKNFQGDTDTTGTVPLNALGTTMCIRVSATRWAAIIGAAG